MYPARNCPECGHGAVTPLSSGRTPVYRCDRCGAVFREPASAPPCGSADLRAVVSRGEGSSICSVHCRPGEVVRVGDHLVAVCGEDAVAVEVTAIECGDHRRQWSPVSGITTLWTRVIEEVDVNISVHDGWRTVPLKLHCPGEEVFTVGEVRNMGGRKVRVRQIKLRNGPMLRKDGWRTVAHRITRIYGSFEP